MPNTIASPTAGTPISPSQLVEEFIDRRGWHRSQVAAKMEKIVPAYQKAYPAQKGQLVAVGESTLSRWGSGGQDKCVNRSKFNAVVWAVLHLEWEASGERGAPPRLQDVARIWNERHGGHQPLLGDTPPGRPTALEDPDLPALEDAEDVDLSDSAQVRFSKAYGVTGAALLQAARAGEEFAALDLGLLCVLDGDRTEGLSWLRTGRTAGNREAASLLAAVASPERATAATARAALNRAESLDGDPCSEERKVLLLERAARVGLKRAAMVLAEHFDRLGEAGSAARWRLSAAQEN